MIPVVFVNCSRFPFLALIMAGLKLYETRTRNTLRALTGQRVYLALTGKGRRPLVLCSAIIQPAIIAPDRKTWGKYRKAAQIRRGSIYDWQPGTRKKYLYKLDDVQPIEPFTPPEGARHGRIWMEYHPTPNDR